MNDGMKVATAMDHLLQTHKMMKKLDHQRIGQRYINATFSGESNPEIFYKQEENEAIQLVHMHLLTRPDLSVALAKLETAQHDAQAFRQSKAKEK